MPRGRRNPPKETVDKYTDLRQAIRALIDQTAVEREVDRIVGVIQREVEGIGGDGGDRPRYEEPRDVTPPDGELTTHQKRLRALEKARAARKAKRERGRERR